MPIPGQESTAVEPRRPLERARPATDKGWQAWLTNSRPPPKRTWQSLGGALRVRLEPGEARLRVFEARLRRKGDKNPRTIEIGSFPTISVADARRKVAEMRSLNSRRSGPCARAAPGASGRELVADAARPDRRVPSPARWTGRRENAPNRKRAARRRSYGEARRSAPR